MTFRFLPISVLLLLGLALQATAQDATSLTTVKQRYQELEGLRASFTQVIGSEFSDDSTRMRGHVLLAGNKYRVETPSQTVVTNGQTTWIYSPADSQVVVNDAGSRESTVTPQAFLTSSVEKYEVSSRRSQTRDGARHIVLELTSTDPSARFTNVTLWVRTADTIVTRLQAENQSDSTLDLRLRDIQIDPPLTGTPFVFSAPDGIEIVDLRSDTSD